MPEPPARPVLQLRITLDGVFPTVWRRVPVPGSIRLVKCSRILRTKNTTVS